MMEENKWLLNFGYALVIVTLSVFIYGLLYNIKGMLSVTMHAQDNSFNTALSLSSSVIAIAVGMIYLNYSTMANVYKIVNISIALLTLFFLAFAFILYPNIEFLHFKIGYALKYQVASGYIQMIENWVYSLFYIFTKLWGVLMLTMFFWQACNQVFSVEQAKKAYPFLIMFSSLGTVAAGAILDVFQAIGSTKISLGILLKYCSICMVISAIIISWCYGILLIPIPSFNHYIVGTSLEYIYTLRSFLLVLFNSGNGIKYMALEDVSESRVSISKLFASKHIVYILIFIICYVIAVKLRRSTPHYHGNMLLAVVYTTVSFIILRIISWRIAALITPVALIIIFIYGHSIHDHEPYYTSLAIAAGLLFFKVTKEVLYIPLESHLKLKGKMMEVIVMQFLEILLVMTPPSIEQILPFLIAGVLSMWIASYYYMKIKL